MKRILSLLGVLIVLGMAVIGCDDGGGGGNGSETDDANTPKSAEWTGGNVVLTLTEIAAPESSGVSAASGAAFSVSDPQPDETFHYTLSVGDTPVSEGAVKIGAASWEFAPATAGQQPFSATVSGDSLVFPAEIVGGISLPLKPNSGVNDNGDDGNSSDGNDNNDDTSGDNDNTKQAYGIALSETATYDFPAATAGYAEQDGKVVTITNKGNQPTGDLTVTLSSGTAFTLDKTAISGIVSNGSGTFTVTPKTGLGAGVYTATVTVSGGVNIAAKSFNVSWTVNASEDTGYSIAEVIAYLDAQEGGKTAGDPVLLQLDINLSSATDGWDALMEALADNDKYVALDLSSCSMDGTEFNIQSGSIFGKMKIVSLVLPGNAASITGSSGDYYISLRTLSGANVTAIGYEAFYGCTSLTSVNFPEVTSIMDGAFYNCKALTSVSFPKATVIMGDSSAYSRGAFGGCTSLSSVYFPEVTSIGDMAFNGCTALITVSFPEAITIGDYAFGYYAYSFSGCTSLKSMSFPKATDIGSSAFSGCTSLTTVSFPKIMDINGRVFDDCTSLTSVAFPEAKIVRESAFSGCTSLTSVSIPKAMIIRSGAFSGCTSLLSASFPEVTTIESGTFSYCTSLTTVSLPEVTNIEDGTMDGIFSGCISLNTVYIPVVTNIGNFAFSKSGTASLTITMGSAVPSVGAYIFFGIDGTKNVTVRVPAGAAGSYDATWKTAFKGDNTNINLLIEYY